MTTAEILTQLQSLGQESTKRVLMKHDIPEPLYGVKIEDMKKLIPKKEKYNHALSLELYDTGVYDAMYLAGLIAEPEKMNKDELRHWAKRATAPVLRESIVAAVAAEGDHGWELALEWIEDSDEAIASTGWATLGHLVSIKDDDALNIPALEQLLQRVAHNIHSQPDRVKSQMNAFVICLGAYVTSLYQKAIEAAQTIGQVTVDMGDTACKVPSAADYIHKTVSRRGVGKKKKMARC
jgi:3-methyladenine DNA glycosylase AlkD